MRHAAAIIPADTFARRYVRERHFGRTAPDDDALDDLALGPGDLQLLLAVLEYRDLLLLGANFLLESKPLVVLRLRVRQLGLEQTYFLCCLLERRSDLRRSKGLASLRTPLCA